MALVVRGGSWNGAVNWRSRSRPGKYNSGGRLVTCLHFNIVSSVHTMCPCVCVFLHYTRNINTVLSVTMRSRHVDATPPPNLQQTITMATGGVFISMITYPEHNWGCGVSLSFGVVVRSSSQKQANVVILRPKTGIFGTGIQGRNTHDDPYIFTIPFVLCTLIRYTPSPWVCVSGSRTFVFFKVGV